MRLPKPQEIARINHNLGNLAKFIFATKRSVSQKKGDSRAAFFFFANAEALHAYFKLQEELLTACVVQDGVAETDATGQQSIVRNVCERTTT